MNVLTFDIEDWYNCDFISSDFEWEKFEVRIYEGVEKILNELSKRNLKGTFFCLGWLAEHHPDIIKDIYKDGHQIGCHSYQHELSFRFDENGFRNDTLKAKTQIERVIGEKITSFRAPGFSITKYNVCALEILSELGFSYDCSIFPAEHDYGGMPSYGSGTPKQIRLMNGNTIKEFPINIQNVFGKSVVFSGGGFFRFFPYFLIRHWAKDSKYMMTYFHPRDFDTGQPVVKSLPMMRKFKSYVGIRSAFSKFQRLLDENDFVNVEQADKLIDWGNVPVLNFEDLK